MAGPGITFLGRVSDAVLADHYARCRALIFPGEEDFGITPLEAMASGKPVIAFGKGGVLETIQPGRTGVLFPKQTVDNLIKAVDECEEGIWTADEIREHAGQFSVENVKDQYLDFISRKFNEFQANQER